MKFNNKKLEKNFKGKIMKKKFWKKIFITKIYTNIDKCHIIFVLLASLDKNRANDRE